MTGRSPSRPLRHPRPYRAEAPGWFSRNWMWVAALGLLPVLCCVGSVLFFKQSIEGTPAYVEAVARAAANPTVQRALGTPIDTGFPTGRYSSGRDDGSMSVNIPLEGRLGEGVLSLRARKAGEGWAIQRASVTVDGRVINLQ